VTAVNVTAERPVDRVLHRLKGVRRVSGGWMAKCPVHDDKTQSLSVAAGRDERVLLNCHAKCATTAIVTALGLSMTDLFPPGMAREREAAKPAPATTRTVQLIKSYDYVDASGTLLFQACRFVDKATGKKTFRQRRPNSVGGWDWSLGDVEPVLYRLPAVLTAVESGRPVFVVEGEKDADALTELGYTATTNPMGAGKWRESMSAVLANADVVILPDNDEPGRAHAQQVAASLTAQGATVKVVELPNLEDKQDVSDWLDRGNDLDALEQIIGATPRWTPDAGTAQHKTRWRLDELWENDLVMRPPPPIVPRLAWSGRSTLLAAREKAGKSTLTSYLTACVSHGRPFLGEPCARGDVLIVGLEEFIGDTARRLRHFGANPKNVHLVDRFAGEVEMRPGELRDHVEAVAPALVILDSLTAYSSGQVKDANNASQMVNVVQPLTDVVHQLGCALIIIHHAAKGTGEPRDSTAITAAVDMVCVFDVPQPDTDPTLRRVRSVGRVPVPRVYDIRFNGNDYELATSAEAPIDERIVALVADRPLVSANDVVDALNARRPEVLNRITALCASGRIRNVSRDRGYKLVVPGHPLALNLA
jgi:putative DNA primase/helicase